jgi:hypothetical protein
MASGRYLSLPTTVAGAAPSSAASAWGYGAWVDVSTYLTSGIYIAGFQFQIENLPTNDVTVMQLFEIGIGSSGSEVTQIQIPYSFRRDSNVGYYHTNEQCVFLPEPVYIPAGTRVAVRAADSLTSAIAYGGVKLIYREGNSPTVALNTPLDTATITDTTPTLNFTGTDIEGDSIEYNVQIGNPGISNFDFTTQTDIQPTKNWTGITVNPNTGDVYAIIMTGTMYKKDGTTGSWSTTSVGVTNTVSAYVDSRNGDVYTAVGSGGYIYKQTGGSGAYASITAAGSRTWGGLSINTTTGDIYACVYNGLIYKQTGGAGVWNDAGAGTGLWGGVSANSSNDDVYACVSGGDIYKQTGGSGSWVALNATGVDRQWYSIYVNDVNGDVWAVEFDGDVYKQTGGVGPFVAQNIAGGVNGWYGAVVNTSNNDIWACIQNGNIYKQNGPLVSAVSTIDTGFTAGHPFGSGVAVDYTVQTPLPTPQANNTYYWRVAAFDPGGSGLYGGWSPTYSFILPEPPFTITGTSDQISGTAIAKVAINGTRDDVHTATIGVDGNWTISGPTKPSAGDSLTVFISNSNESTILKSTAVTTYNGSGAVGGMVLNGHTLSIGSDQNRSLVLSDFANYDYDQDNANILHSSNGSPATLLIKFANGSSYVDEKIDILAGNTLTIGATETLTAHDVEINGTLVSGGASTYNISGDWANNGTFTASTSIVTLGGTDTQALSGTLTGTSSFYNLTITNNSGASASDNERTDFVPSVDFNASASVTNNYTINTSDVRVEYEGGATYEFANIDWVGAESHLIYFRNSDVSTTWSLKVTGSQTVSYVNVSRSVAIVTDGGMPIIAYDGTNFNALYNTNWSFSNNRVRQEINLINGSFASLSSQAMSVGLSSLSNVNYSGSVTGYYEVVATNTDSVARTIYLRNWANNTIYAQLDVPSGTSVPTRVRSSAITFPTSITTVYVNGPQTTSDGQVVISSARVIVFQDIGSSPLTSTETQIEIGNYETGKNNLTPSAPLTYPKYWFATNANWSNTKTFYAEVTYRTSATNAYCTVVLQKDAAGDLATWSDVVTIVNAQASSSANYPMLSSRITFTPEDGCNYRIASFLSTSSATYNIYNAKIIVIQTGDINKLEPQYLLLNKYSNTTGQQNADNYWDPADWNGINAAYYHEINSDQYTSDSASLQSDPDGAQVHIPNSTTTGSYRTRSFGPMTMPETAATIDTIVISVPIYASRIIAIVNNLPRVSLGTPLDTAMGVVVNPHLTFTGTDPEGDDLEYQFQLDTVNTFDSIPGGSGGTIYSNSFEAAGWTSVVVSGTTNPLWTIATSATHPTATPQNGTYLAFFNSYTCNVPASARFYPNSTFDIPSSAGTATLTYQMYKSTAYPSNNDRVQLQISTNGGTDWADVGAAVPIYDGTVGWAQVSIDLADYIGDSSILIGLLGITAYGDNCVVDNISVSYVLPDTPIVNELSTVDAGFTAGHPFSSGSEIEYVIQSADTLIESYTYYWRVRAIDPLGKNLYGDWSEIRSFSVGNIPPSVVLNSPNDTEMTSLSPTLNFTGTDPEGDGVEYNVQLDTVNTFDSQSGNPLISAFSVTDAGFSDGHPFTSGNAVDYTVQSSLSIGIYYWRVAAIDPLGRNIYGAWSETRSLEVVSNAPPLAVVLNSPSDGAAGVVVNPHLKFTGTDSEGDEIEYELQLDTSSAFDSNGGGSGTVVVSNSFEAGGWTSVLVSGANASWTTVTSSTRPAGVPIQDGTRIAAFNSYTCSAGAQARYYTSVNFSIPSNAGSANVTFWMYHETGYPAANDRVQFQMSSNGGASWANVGDAVSRYNGTTGWAMATVDASSYIGKSTLRIAFLGISGYGNDCHVDNVTLTYNLPLLDKVSTVDAGFTAGHPYTSGVLTEYIVQAGDTLTNNTTYYWRVRAIDPLGRNTYGMWSTPRSFTPNKGVKIYDGAVWNYKPVKFWNGTDWVEKPVKVWDGSEWVIHG